MSDNTILFQHLFNKSFNHLFILLKQLTMKRILTFLGIIFYTITISNAQVAAFDFQGLLGDEVSDNADVVDSDINSPVTITRGGVTASANGGRFTSTNWPVATSPDLAKYLEFTLTPIMDASVTVSSIDMKHRRSGTGPINFQLRSSKDGYALPIGGVITITDVTTNNTSAFTSLGITSTSSVTFRIYAYSAEATGGTWGPGDAAVGNDLVVNGTAALLPVELKSIKVSKKNAAAQLSWQTATENNNSHFDIERSNDGVKFSKLEAVKGHGTTNVVQDYTFMDDAPLKNINYYRLRQVDFDGKETISKTVSINFEGKGQAKAKVYPTLVKDVVNIEFSQDTKSELSVRDLTGRVILTQNTPEGINVGTLNLSSLNSGMYILSIRSNEGVETVKIQKY